MERDFMGLNSKDTIVKEEALDGCTEPVFPKSSKVRWSLSNGFEAFHNHQADEIQSAYSIQLHHKNKHVVPGTMNIPYFRPHFTGAPVNPQLLGGVFVTSHPVLPWYSLKASSAPAQLSIFYGGMVNVYDDISPEKAQAIMFLAGNGAFVAAANTPHPSAQAQVLTPVTPARDAVHESQPLNTKPGSVISSPMSVSSHPIGHLAGGPAANRGEAAKTIGCSAAPLTKVDTPRIMSSLGQVMQSAAPQARKASLARFLEKRKERVMALAPYGLSKNASDCAASSDALVVASEQRE